MTSDDLTSAHNGPPLRQYEIWVRAARGISSGSHGAGSSGKVLICCARPSGDIILDM